MYITESTAQVDGRTTHRTPEGTLTSLDLLLGRLSQHVHPGGATVILGEGAHELVGLPQRLPARQIIDHPALDAARATGWNVSELSPWMTFWRNGSPSIHIGIGPWLTPGTFPLDDQTPAIAQMRLYWFHQWLGVPFHGKTAGLAGIALLRDHYKGITPMWCPEWDKIEPANQTTEVVTAGWRTALAHELAYEHQFDARLQFLSAAISADVAVGALRRPWRPAIATGRHVLPGYYLVTVPPWHFADRIPHPIGARHEPGDKVWITGATLDLLNEVCEVYDVLTPVEVHDAWVAAGGRVLRGWGETVRDAEKLARQYGDDVLHRVVKDVYKAGIGMLATRTGRVRRPDWEHTIVGLARSNLWRKMWREGIERGRWPVEINADAVWYASASSEPDWPKVFPDRPGPGGFHHEGTREVTR